MQLEMVVAALTALSLSQGCVHGGVKDSLHDQNSKPGLHNLERSFSGDMTNLCLPVHFCSVSLRHRYSYSHSTQLFHSP